MTNPNVSIIIPVYNIDNEYLTKCIESVLIQKGADFEVIMVDDGSTNGCSEWCDDWAKKDSRIRVIHKQNGGVSSARNVGIKESKGEYLIFIDPDDWWEPDLIERTYETISKNNCDLLFFGLREEYLNRQIPRPCFENTGDYHQVDECLRRGIMIGLIDYTVRKIPAVFGACWNSMIRRTIVFNNEIFFPEDIFHGEDSVFIFSLLVIACNVGILDLELYHYRYSYTSITKRFVPQFEKNHEKVINAFSQAVSASHDDPDFRNSLVFYTADRYCLVLLQDYFHIDNKEKMKDKRKRWNNLSKSSIFAEILGSADYKMLFHKSLSYSAVAYFTFKHRNFCIVALLTALARTRLNIKANI